MKIYDVVVIGGGPAGLAAAIEAKKNDAKVLLIEREARLGGVLKQCIHDGFGLVRFGKKLSGPEYAQRFIREFHELEIDFLTMTFVTDIKKDNGEFELVFVNGEGLSHCKTKSVILATGCRERTAKQVSIHGTRPAGIFTAGTAQNYVNILGQMPTKKCVILGSGDIGLIMARRLTLEGAEVVGVYEAKPTPSGLERNIVQCLNDFDIPLSLSHTVTRVFGHDRLTAVEISQVDSNMKPVEGTEEIIECDALILSVGLIPENEVAKQLGVTIDSKTRGPVCSENMMTDVDGIFSCGNAYHVFDLVDYVSENGELAGRGAAEYSKSVKAGLQKVEDTGSAEAAESADSGTEAAKAGAQKAAETAKNQESPKATGENAKTGEAVDEEAIYMTCIVCPNSCKLKIKEENGTYNVTGNKCPRGEAFAISELTNPTRTLCTTVASDFCDAPVVPVRLSAEVPKGRIFECMKEINKVKLEERLEEGDVVIENILGLGADVIVTSDILKGDI